MKYPIKKIFTIIRLIVFAAIPMSSLAGGPESDERPERYVYCNVYLDTICFGISQNDQLEMKIPVDFMLYDLKLSFGGSVRVYYGSQPEEIESKLRVPKEVCKAKAKICSLYRTPENDYRLQYQAKNSDEVLDIFLSEVNESDYEIYNDFLSNFKPCTANGSSIECIEESAFIDSVLAF